jgi:AcrR family transcriptional regulator
MDDVAASCGVTKLIVYRHFESKEELYREILQRVLDRLGEELRTSIAAGARTGLGARTLLTVAREEPAAFMLLWRQAANEPQFAAYAADLRSTSVRVVRQLSNLDSGDETIDEWRAYVVFGWLVESTLGWLERGDVRRDDEFINEVSLALRGIRAEWIDR